MNAHAGLLPLPWQDFTTMTPLGVRRSLPDVRTFSYRYNKSKCACTTLYNLSECLYNVYWLKYTQPWVHCMATGQKPKSRLLRHQSRRLCHKSWPELTKLVFHATDRQSHKQRFGSVLAKWKEKHQCSSMRETNCLLAVKLNAHEVQKLPPTSKAQNHLHKKVLPVL